MKVKRWHVTGFSGLSIRVNSGNHLIRRHRRDHEGNGILYRKPKTLPSNFLLTMNKSHVWRMAEDVTINTHNFRNLVNGSVAGDQVGGSKFGGDQVAGSKVRTPDVLFQILV